MLLTNSTGTDIVSIGQNGSWFNSGNVGIGTSSPLNGLNVFSMGNFNAGSIRFGFSGTNDAVVSLGYNSLTGRDALKFSYSPHNSTSGQVDLMTLDLNGKVGIGTSTPDGFQVNTTLSGENSLGVSNIRMGIMAGAPRLIFDAAGATPFQIDNSGGQLRIFNPGVVRLAINADGNVGIGTTTPDTKLAVKGTIHANEVKVDLVVPGPDYVFEKSYALPTLAEVKTYIDQNKHLPEIPSAKEMEKNGIKLGEMNMLLLKKIEELTLYVIHLKKDNEELRREIKNWKAK